MHIITRGEKYHGQNITPTVAFEGDSVWGEISLETNIELLILKEETWKIWIRFPF